MKIASLIVYSFIFRFLIAHGPMRGHIMVVQMKNYFECALECKLESNCFSWKYFEKETRCILESEYLHSINYKKSFSTNNATYVGDKNFIEHFTDHKLHAPLIMRSTTSYSFPQSFIAGCTYSISTWAWMWPSNSTQKQHIFGVIPTEPSIREVATLYPGVIFNYIRTRKFFFSFSAKDHIAEDYFGHFAGLVQYRKWVHVTIVITPTHAKSFINGIYSGLVKMEDLYDMDKDILSATPYCYTKETYQHRLEKYSLVAAPLPDITLSQAVPAQFPQGVKEFIEAAANSDQVTVYTDGSFELVRVPLLESLTLSRTDQTAQYGRGRQGSMSHPLQVAQPSHSS